MCVWGGGLTFLVQKTHTKYAAPTSVAQDTICLKASNACLFHERAQTRDCPDEIQIRNGNTETDGAWQDPRSR